MICKAEIQEISHSTNYNRSIFFACPFKLIHLLYFISYACIYGSVQKIWRVLITSYIRLFHRLRKLIKILVDHSQVISSPRDILNYWSFTLNWPSFLEKSLNLGKHLFWKIPIQSKTWKEKEYKHSMKKKELAFSKDDKCARAHVLIHSHITTAKMLNHAIEVTFGVRFFLWVFVGIFGLSTLRFMEHILVGSFYFFFLCMLIKYNFLGFFQIVVINTVKLC